MLQTLILMSLLFKASALQITSYGNTVAEYGGQAIYSCQVDSQKGVRQVTWQRLSRDESVENMATYSKRFGQQVNTPFLGKVVFTEASFSSPSITLTNVSWQDEGCYICSFNVFPDGSQRKQTCLRVQGISAVDTSHVFGDRQEEGEEVAVGFSCSATGKPAPSIEWDISAGATDLDHPQAVTVKNDDHTFTSSSNITLRVPAGWNGHVDCLLNGGQKRERIPFSASARSPKKKDEKRSWLVPVVSSGAVATCVAVAAALFIRRKRLKLNRRNEIVL